MYHHESTIRVRYSETDQMGMVYHGHFATYCEVARVEALRALGLRYAELESEYGLLLPVVNMHMRFLRPVRYDDLLSLKTSIPKMPDEHIIFNTDICLDTGKIAVAARIALCFLRAGDRARQSTPMFIKALLTPYFEET